MNPVYLDHRVNNVKPIGRVSEFDPVLVRQGYASAVITCFGGTYFPLRPTQDYSLLNDYDIAVARVYAGSTVRGDTLELARLIKLKEQGKLTVPLMVYFEDITVSPYSHIIDFACRLLKRVDMMTYPFIGDKEKFDKRGFTNHRYLPFPLDVKWYKQFRRLRSGKKNIGAGIFHVRSNVWWGGNPRVKVHAETFDCLKELRNNFGVQPRFYLNMDGRAKRFKPYVDQIGLPVEFIPFISGQTEFANHVAENLIFLEEYHCNNQSQLTIVSLCTGTPVVGTRYNSVLSLANPDLCVEHGDWEAWRKLAGRLVADEEFYRMQAEKGFRGVEQFSLEYYREMFLSLYEEIKK